MSHQVRVAASALLLGLLTACASWGPSPTLTVVVVRHAEKALDDPRDPELNASGTARAQRLAAATSTAPLVAVYATEYRRTQQTAAPTALLHGLSISAYDSRTPAAVFASSLRQAHRSGHVLVVAHSNTAPAIAAALCGCDVPAMDENEYDRRMTVQIPRRGPALLITASMP